MQSQIFDHMTLDQLADEARQATVMAHTQMSKHDAGKAQSSARDAEFWLAVLQARTNLDAAIDHAKTNRRLVWATWVLAAATIWLAVAS